MNWRKYGLAVLAVFLTMMTTGFVVHAVLLADDYKALGSLMRSEEDQIRHFPYNVLAHIAMALGVVWIYAKGVEPKPWAGQGVRFGLAFWLVGWVGVYLIYFAVQPLAPALVAKQIVYGLGEALLMGMVAAAVYRK